MLLRFEAISVYSDFYAQHTIIFQTAAAALSYADLKKIIGLSALRTLRN